MATNIASLFDLNVNIILSITAIIGVIIAIVTLIQQDRRAKYSLGVEVLLKLEDVFNNSAFIKKRKKVAKLIIKENFEPLTESKKIEKETLLGEILDHFQLVGILYYKKVIDIELIHSEYYYWIQNYYYFSKAQIIESRKNHSSQTIWEDVEKLFIKLETYENIMNESKSAKDRNKKYREDFLLTESKLH